MKSLPFVLMILLLSPALALFLPSNPEVDYEDQPYLLSSDWRIETIAHFQGSSEPDIEMDSMNRPHILYCPPGEVWYGFRDDLGWNLELVTETVGGGICGSMALGPHDEAYINFYIWAPGKPYDRFAVKVNGAWKLLYIPINAADMVVDANGTLHAVGREAYNPNLVYATRHSGIWRLENISLYNPSGSHWASIELDSSDNPHILYYADTIGEVRYAYKDNGTWKIEVVDVIGNIGYVGRHGSLDIDSKGRLHAAYLAFVNWEENRATLRYAVRTVSGWLIETVASPPMLQGLFASLNLDVDDNPSIAYVRFDNAPGRTVEEGLYYATKSPSGLWSIESVGFPSAWFVDFELDSCGNPHIVTYGGTNITNAGVYYATKGEPCPPEPESEPSVSLDIDPNTLNLKSRGRWITAYLRAENASVEDIDISSVLLQDTLIPQRWEYQGDTLMLKFSREELQSLLTVGDSIEIKIRGKWKDGTYFEAFDTIRVINPGNKDKK